MTAEYMIALLSLWVIKPLLILLIVAVGAGLLRKTSAALQHFWLMCGLTALLILPLLSLVLPNVSWAVLPMDGPMMTHFFLWLEHVVAYFSHPTHALVLLGIYLFPVFLSLFYFLLGIGHIQQQQASDIPCADQELNELLEDLHSELGLDRPVRLHLGRSVTSPHMWGIWHPVIRLPLSAAHWSSERKLSVLLHELAHAARGDWFSLVMVKIVCAIFWFLPPVWWLAARLEDCAEIACDDFIYRLRDKHLVYAENLLALACMPEQVDLSLKKHTAPVPFMSAPMVGHSPMYYRIQAVLDTRRSRTPVAVEREQYWVLACLLLLLPLAAVQLMPIREAMQIHWLTLQSPEPTENNQRDTEIPAIVLINPLTLQEIKQTFLATNLPAQRIGLVDEIRVWAEMPVFKPEQSPVVIEYPRSVPLIRIEGYAPLQTRMPIYPAHALQRGIEGEVLVRFDIDENGRIVSPEILQANPRRVFERVVLAALQDSRYLPQRLDGQPVLLKGVIEKFTFQLDVDTGDP